MHGGIPETLIYLQLHLVEPWKLFFEGKMWFYMFTLLIGIHCCWFDVSPIYLMKFLHHESLLLLVSA